MYTDMYKNLRLLGYKVNELPNGYFIAQRPDESKTLFGTDGNVIIPKFKNIVPLSDFLLHLHR